MHYQSYRYILKVNDYVCLVTKFLYSDNTNLTGHVGFISILFDMTFISTFPGLYIIERQECIIEGFLLSYLLQ